MWFVLGMLRVLLRMFIFGWCWFVIIWGVFIFCAMVILRLWSTFCVNGFMWWFMWGLFMRWILIRWLRFCLRLVRSWLLFILMRFWRCQRCREWMNLVRVCLCFVLLLRFVLGCICLLSEFFVNGLKRFFSVIRLRFFIFVRWRFIVMGRVMCCSLCFWSVSSVGFNRLCNI